MKTQKKYSERLHLKRKPLLLLIPDGLMFMDENKNQIGIIAVGKKT